MSHLLQLLLLKLAQSTAHLPVLMVSIRQLLTDHHRALHSFRGAEWLLDQDISDSFLEERVQWIYIQLILTILLGRHLQFRLVEP